MRSKAKNATRLVLYVGLLYLELGLVLSFYVFPQFEAHAFDARYDDVGDTGFWPNSVIRHSQDLR